MFNLTKSQPNGELEEAVAELFERFENEDVADKRAAVRKHFLTKINENRGLQLATDYKEMQRVAGAIESDILPAYATYEKRRNEILTRQMGRDWKRYVVGTVIALEVVELLFTRGRVLQPRVLIPSILIDSMFGGLVYGCVQTVDNFRIDAARRRFEKTVRSVHKRLERESAYGTSNEDPFLELEMNNVLANYETATSFWDEYTRVKQADPTSEEAFKKLDAPRFEEFVKPHYTMENADEREQRFSNLFLRAHQAFVTRDPTYINRQLGTGNNLEARAETPLLNAPSAAGEALACEHDREPDFIRRRGGVKYG